MIIDKLDLTGFTKELNELYKSVKQDVGKKDLNHLKKIDWTLRLLWLGGLAMSWFFINPVAIACIGLAKSGRWTMMGHHVGHGAYDKIKGVPKKYTSKYFAKGWRRWIDWMDWMLPSAWEFEHNILHHYHTGEMVDPDYPQKNTHTLRTKKWPMVIKYIHAFFIMASWKFSYYAPNTLWYLEQKKKSGTALQKSLKEEEQRAVSFPGSRIYSLKTPEGRKFWSICILPYFFYNFILIPLLFFPLGLKAVIFVWVNLFFAEILTNVWTFCTIVTNHAGDDIPYFTSGVKTKEEFNFRQVIGSVNFNGGTPVKDFLHGYVNYQIEHHLWPGATMRSYIKLQPQVQQICKKYNIPYVKDSVFTRTKKLVDMMVGSADMRPLDEIHLTKVEALN